MKTLDHSFDHLLTMDQLANFPWFHKYSLHVLSNSKSTKNRSILLGSRGMKMKVMFENYVTVYENALVVKFLSQNLEGVSQSRARIIHKTKEFFQWEYARLIVGFGR